MMELEDTIELEITYKKLGVIIFRIVLILAILEVGLRVSGYARMQFQLHESKLLEKPGEEFRILALGESTTADLHNGQGSWPMELNKILNNLSNKYNYVVINDAVPSTSTDEILHKLGKNLDK